MDEFDRRPSRLAALPLALIFLFEFWIWRKLVAIAQFVATLVPWQRFRDAARRYVNRAPAFVSVALFGVPLVVSEFGAFVSVVTMATGHLFAGFALYVGMKIFGLFLVPVIFEITRERLMALPWFSYLYGKFEAVHYWASALVAPYRQAARETASEIGAALRRRLRELFYAPASAARASAAKAETLASSARAVPGKPASPSH